MVDSRTDVRVVETWRAEDLTEPEQSERGQRGQPNQHAHDAHQNDKAGGEAMVLRSRELKHRGRQRRDDYPKTKTACPERDISRPDGADAQCQLAGMPAGPLKKCSRRAQYANDRGP